MRTSLRTCETRLEFAMTGVKPPACPRVAHARAGREHRMIRAELDQAIGIITLDRPQKANAMHAQAKRDLAAQIKAWDRDDGVSAIVISGKGKHFCAGSDIAEMSGFNPLEMRSMLEGERAMYLAALRSRKPVVAAVNGAALGAGFILTMCCDYTVASDQATFGTPELQIGVTAPLEGLLLPWIVGVGHARAMFYAQRRLDAVTAASLGLVHEIIPGPDPTQRGIECARDLGALPGEGFPLQKEFLLRMLQQSGLEFASVLSMHATSLQFVSGETQQAMKSFLDRRS
jgi:enoyl-CoA hydratase/carnithine racemase